MHAAYVIALDTHCAFTELAILSPAGRRRRSDRCVTTIPALVERIEAVPRPRHVVFEEGPLAGWLFRELGPYADKVVPCEPRRNALIAKAGDKDDAIDAQKLAELYRGNFVQPVHHPQDRERAYFKQVVAGYHRGVRRRVRVSNQLLGVFRQQGVFLTTTDLGRPVREAALALLPPHRPLRSMVRLALEEFDGQSHEILVLQKLIRRMARPYEAIRRFVAVPGIQWIRAATFFAYIDTPWRFASKSALWKYVGLGLERQHSGAGPVRLRLVSRDRVCRPLKNVLMGAAISALRTQDQPFAEQNRRWLHAGLTPRTARRNVARSLAVTLWGMFKTGNVYRPEWVGVPPVARCPQGS